MSRIYKFFLFLWWMAFSRKAPDWEVPLELKGEVQKALVRYACVMRSLDKEGVGVPYLRALDGSGVGVHVLPVGAIQFTVPPWDEFQHLFVTSLQDRFINVVCCPPGCPLPGRYLPTEKPPSAISGFFTVGVINVAICGPGDYSTEEVEKLKLYNRVICPTEDVTKALEKRGVLARTIPPDPKKLSSLFSAMTAA